MKTTTRLMLVSLVTLFLVAYGHESIDNGGQPGDGTTYTDVFFKTVEERASNTVVVGDADLTLSNGQLSGTLQAYSGNFPNDTGSISGTYRAAGTQGDKQVYTADLQIDFSSAPDYTASGRFYTVAGKVFTEEPMVLSKNGSQVGEFILDENDNGDNGDEDYDNNDADSNVDDNVNPQPGLPGDGCYIHLFVNDNFDSSDTDDIIVGPGEFANLRNLSGAADDDWGDEMDSLKVGSAATVQVWEDEGFQGNTQTLQPGTEQPDAVEFSSMKISCFN